MIYQRVVITAGLSIFGFRNIFGAVTREKEIFQFAKDNVTPLCPEDKTPSEAIQDWISDLSSVMNEAKDKPSMVSAEYSMVYRLQQNNRLVEKPKVVVIHTDTFGGIAAAELLKVVFERDFRADVQLVGIEELDVNNRKQLNRSLAVFIQRLSEQLNYQYLKGSTCFAPIGGFKVMTSYGYIVGSFYGYPTAYMHENQQVLLEIPPVPIQIDDEFIRQNANWLRQLYLEDVMELNQLDYHQKEAVKKHTVFFEIDEPYIALNPFGKFIFSQQKFAPYFSKKVYITTEFQKVMAKNPSSEEFIYEEIRGMMEKLDAEHLNLGVLYHEKTFKVLNNTKLSYSLYKGFSSKWTSKPVFRVAWRFDKKEHALYLNYLWLNHQTYELEAADGKGLKETLGEYIDITEKVYQQKVTATVR